jgi:type II secretory pathway pseudopilin PulG
MPIIIAVIFFFSGLFGGLVSSNYTSVQFNARDTERTSDINAIHSQLEAYYAEYGYYPNSDSLKNDATLLRGLDPQALIDPESKHINQGGDYIYRAIGCVSTQCQTYTLTAQLEDGEVYTKDSLN